MDSIVEIILEIFIEGASEAVSEKCLPSPVRVLAAVLLLVFYGGIVGFLILLAVKSRSLAVTGIAVFMVIITAAVIVKKYRELR